MQWDLAGYDGHPIDGDASQVATCAAHLGDVAKKIDAQVCLLREQDMLSCWESPAGAADAFQDVVDDLPEKLELVKTRYASVAAALDAFHPVLAETKSEAENQILLAEEANDELEEAHRKLAEKVEWEEQEARRAELHDEHAGSDDPPYQHEDWPYEDPHFALDDAQEKLNSAVENVRKAVEDFDLAAFTCSDAIYWACDDDLQSGILDGLRHVRDAVLDAVEVIVEWLEMIAGVLGVVALILLGIAALVTAPFITGLLTVIAALAAVASIGVVLATVVLYLSGRVTFWDTALAGLGLAIATVGMTISAPVVAVASAGLGVLEIHDFLSDDEFEELFDRISYGNAFPSIVGPPLFTLLFGGESRPGAELTWVADLKNLILSYEIAQPAPEIDIPVSELLPPDVNVPSFDVPALLTPASNLSLIVLEVNVPVPVGAPR